VSNTLSDPYLFIAFWTGIGALGLTLLLAAQIIALRIGLRRQQRLEQACIRQWRPLLNAALAHDAPAAPPQLRTKEQVVFLKLWVHLQASLRGEAHDTLNAFARRLGCDAIARRLLARGNRAERLLATLVLGYLRDPEAWQPLRKAANDADGVAASNAFWALVRIDAPRAAQEMTLAFIARRDWPVAQIVNILQDARESFAGPLVRALSAIDESLLPRTLRIAESLRIAIPPVLLASLLAHESVAVIIAALRIAHAPESLPAIRRHLAHPDWQVRVNVAKALGRIGERSDIDSLRLLLADPQWWVRYRTAQALADMPFVGRQELEAVAVGMEDRFAADILKQVIAEKELA
jgi:hypothetical protein